MRSCWQRLSRRHFSDRQGAHSTVFLAMVWRVPRGRFQAGSLGPNSVRQVEPVCAARCGSELSTAMVS